MLTDTALITQDDALTTIGQERLTLLRDVQLHGWRAWEAIRATKEGSELSTSARARIVYDATVRRAVECFPTEAIEWHHGLLVLDVGNALARFKKVTDDLTPRGIPTGQSSLFDHQGHVADPTQMSLWPPKPMLVVGYVVDRLGATIQRQVLMLRQHGRVIWWHDLPSEDGLQAFPAAGGPIPSDGPRPALVRSTRVREEAREEAQ